MDNPSLQQINRKLQETQHILITSHIHPDWDAVGSILGFGLSLIQTGKNVQMVLEDGVSQKYKHLPGSEFIVKGATKPFELSIVVDCSDLSRVGNVLKGNQPDINIDHHITNLDFGHINFVEPQAAATAVILAEYLPLWNLPITKDVATALLTGIIGDTIGFRTSSTTSKELRLSAFLIEQGANLPTLYHHTLSQQSFEAAQYWGAGLQKLQREGQIVWTSLSLEERKWAKYPGNDDADLINHLSSINHSQIAILFIEQNDRSVKVSWRAGQGLNVARVALSFGGGGHAPAAGAEIKGSLQEVQRMVLDTTQEMLKTELSNMNKDRNNTIKKSNSGAFLRKQEGI
jgi:phosphoesterase RecJ-like protein